MTSFHDRDLAMEAFKILPQTKILMGGELFFKSKGEMTAVLCLDSDNIIELDLQGEKVLNLVKESPDFESLVQKCIIIYGSMEENELNWLKEFLLKLYELKFVILVNA